MTSPSDEAPEPPKYRGGCRPKMAGCSFRCGHYTIVRDYQQERERQEHAREDATGGYRTEIAEHPRLIDFRTYLLNRAGRGARP